MRVSKIQSWSSFLFVMIALCGASATASDQEWHLNREISVDASSITEDRGPISLTITVRSGEETVEVVVEVPAETEEVAELVDDSEEDDINDPHGKRTMITIEINPRERP